MKDEGKPQSRNQVLPLRFQKHSVSQHLLVSIVTPSYNQGTYLDQAIQSVLSQDYPFIEYIIMDGGSKDNSVEVIQRYADRLVCWESQPDRGQAHAINKGLLRAKGEIMGWLNSDDVLLPSTVSDVVRAFDQNPEVDVVYGRLERMDARGRVIPTPVLPKDRLVFSKEYVVGECLVNQPGSFWRRRIMEKAGMLEERLVYALDYELWIRMALSGARFLHLPQVVAQFRLSEDTKTVSRSAAMAQEQLSVLEKLLAQRDLAEKLKFSGRQLNQREGKARANISLHVFYGYWKSHRWTEAGYWFFRALRYDPLVLFQRRWFDLLGASFFQTFEYSGSEDEIGRR
jgi:glycosyltransferase involved in cell wall biosynthesis